MDAVVILIDGTTIRLPAPDTLWCAAAEDGGPPAGVLLFGRTQPTDDFPYTHNLAPGESAWIPTHQIRAVLVVHSGTTDYLQPYAVLAPIA